MPEIWRIWWRSFLGVLAVSSGGEGHGHVGFYAADFTIESLTVY